MPPSCTVLAREFALIRPSFSEPYRTDALAHNNRGLVKRKLGDVEGAWADWMRALELQPGMREAEQNLKRLPAPGE